MKRELPEETGEPVSRDDHAAATAEAEANFRPCSAVLGRRDLCNGLLVPFLNLMDVVNLSRTCTRMQFVLKDNTHLKIARDAWRLGLGVAPIFGTSQWTAALRVTIGHCAKEGSLLAFRHFFKSRVWTLLEEAQLLSLADVPDPEVYMSFSPDTDHGKRCMELFSKTIMGVLIEAGGQAAVNGHAHVVADVARWCKQTPRSNLSPDPLAEHEFSVLAFTVLRSAAIGGHLRICRRFSSADIWGIDPKTFSDVFVFDTVAEQLIKCQTLKELEEWGVLAIPPKKVRGHRLLRYAMHNRRDTAVFDWAYAATRAGGSKKTLGYCVGRVAERGNMDLMKHVAQRMLLEEVAHLKEAGLRVQWETALAEIGKIKQVTSKTPEKQERKDACIHWVYEQAGFTFFKDMSSALASAYSRIETGWTFRGDDNDN